MIVKVIKSNDLAWYKDFVERLCVVEILDDSYYIVAGSDTHLIAIADCTNIDSMSELRKVVMDEKLNWILI